MGLGGGLHGGGLVVVVLPLNMDIGSGLHVRISIVRLGTLLTTGGGFGVGLGEQITSPGV